MMWKRISIPFVILLITAIAMTLPATVQAVPNGFYRAGILVVLGAIAFWAIQSSLKPLDEAARVIKRSKEGTPIEAGDWDGEVAILMNHAESTSALVSAQNKRLSIMEQERDALVDALEKLVEGDYSTSSKTPKTRQELGAGFDMINTLREDLREFGLEMAALAKGDLGLDQTLVVNKVTHLSQVDLPQEKTSHELRVEFIKLVNQLRRLAVQSNIIASDQLQNQLLNDTVGGSLGEGMMEIVQSLRGLTQVAQRVAQGDLSAQIDTTGDLGHSFGDMVLNLRQIVERIAQMAIHISTSAEQILVVLRNQELSASHQASGVEETQRTMETLLSSAKKIAESAQTVFKSAERSQANNRIISDRAAELKTHTERIGEILESIKEIADRSDLLALNASLEGLRAGEAGKSFTLVAGEMRRLAETIKGSVNDVKDLLGDMRSSALSSVMAIEEGSKLSERTTDSALKISLITQQQQSGTEQVTQSMEELSLLITQGLSGTQQVTSATAELTQLAEDLRLIVDTFSLEHTAYRAPLETSYRRPRFSSPSGVPALVTASTMPAARPSLNPISYDLRSTISSTRPRMDTPRGLSPVSRTMGEDATRFGRELDATGRFDPNSPEMKAHLMTSSGFASQLNTGELDIPDGSPTIDVSTLREESGGVLSVDNAERLFDELSKHPSVPSSDESMERTFDALDEESSEEL